MMNAKRIVLGLFVCMLMAAAPICQGEWIPLNNSPEGSVPDIKVLSSDSEHTVISVTIPGFYVDKTSFEGTEYDVITVPDTSKMLKLGVPAVPELEISVGIPDSAGVKIREISRTSIPMEGFLLEPVQQQERDLPEIYEYQFNPAIYGSDKDFPLTAVNVSDPAIMRDLRLVTATVYPVVVQPKSQTLSAASEIVFELIYDESPSANIKYRQDMMVSPRFEPIYRKAIVNYDYMAFEKGGDRDTSIKYLIIADDALVAPVQPLADWYHRVGLKPIIRPISEVGATQAAVMTEITNYYNTEGIEFVLLVGELEQIPLGQTSPDPGDYTYQLLEGGDNYADVACGRFYTDDPDTVSHIIARIFNYVQNPLSDGWLERTMMAAHEEEYPGKYTLCKDEIIAYSYSLQTPIFDTYYPPEGATHQGVVDAMLDGRGLINYRGHGDTQEWSWSLDWTPSDIYNLGNGRHTSVVWNICCNNGEVDSGSECLAEAWQNAGASGEGGAVANLAATRPSYTIANHEFDKMLYRAPFDEGITRLGPVVDRSKMYMIFMEGDYGIDNAFMYITFGDPAMDITTMDPVTLDVDHLPTTPIGGSDYEVNVSYNSSPIEGALVCIYKSGEAYEVGTTDSLGNVTLPALLTSGGTMMLTVTYHNALPYMADILVEAAGCGAMLLDRSLYNCDQTIMVRVWDSDLDLNPGEPDFTTVDISSTSEAVPETITLVETGNDTSEFRGTIQTSSTESGPGYLLIAHDDNILAVYHDADCDGSSRDVEDSAVADCVGPIISGLSVTGLGLDTVTISWNTDELSNSVVTWGPGVPPAIVETNDQMVLDHSITLTGLDTCTDYFFKVSSMDSGANVAEDDNGGSYYSFTTLQFITLLSSDMNSDPGWTYDGQWAYGVPTGSGGDPSSGYTGDNVVGYNLNGVYEDNLSAVYTTTPPFDCSSASQTYLSYWKWLGVESASYDHATVEISVDGGSGWDTVWEHTGSSVGPSDWSFDELDISTWAAGQSDVRLRWGMGPTDGSQVYCGWNIDDVMVSYTTACTVPILVHDSHLIDDSAGNNDGAINAGETISVTIVLENQGLDATGVTGTISTSNPHVTITADSSNYPDIPQSGTGTSLTDYVFEVSPEATDGESIPLSISWTSNENTGTTSFSELVVAPTLTVSGYQIIEGAGSDNDGVWDPGETVQFSVTLMNTGNGAAYNVTGDMSTNLPTYVTVDDGMADFPDIAGGDSGSSYFPHFTLTADAGTPDHSMVTINVALSADGYVVNDSFTLEITDSNFALRYLYDMNADPDWTPEGNWEYGIPLGNDDDPSSGYTGDNVYGYNLAGDYTNSMPETNLTSGAIDCSSLSLTEVRFMRWLGVESAAYDHAAFQVSNDGTNWTALYDHSGSSFTDSDWQAMSYDISAVADGQATVYLRWVMGTTDSTVVYCGWNVDDVQIWGESTIEECLHTGDATQDGEVTSGDAQLTFQIALGMVEPSYIEECAADCNGDGVCSSGDAQGVFIMALGEGTCADPLPTLKSGSTGTIVQNIRSNDTVWIEGRPGIDGTVLVDIMIANDETPMDVFTLELGFDAGVYEFLSCSPGTLDPGWIEFGCYLRENGLLRIGAYQSGQMISTNSFGSLVTLEFDGDSNLISSWDQPDFKLLRILDDLKSFRLE